MRSRKETLILVVEAGETALSTRKLILETAGYNVISAVAAEQALRFANSYDFDFIIYDTDVHDLDPVAAIGRLRERCPVPLYLLTAQPWPPEGMKGLADGLFVKMDDPQEMIGVIERLLEPERRSDVAS